MRTTLEEVKIVEYHNGLAQGVAKMWNESRENWGGGFHCHNRAGCS
ncbi:hypothetical protein [Bacillus sp. KH172YL63]|nr:hypothetical protein [Bacillus sp. KH172YL63]BCB03709.1 hypothetical protein KH172YL63_18420 [Bacillus sp. KH172YL63]